MIFNINVCALVLLLVHWIQFRLNPAPAPERKFFLWGMAVAYCVVLPV